MKDKYIYNYIYCHNRLIVSNYKVSLVCHKMLLQFWSMFWGLKKVDGARIQVGIVSVLRVLGFNSVGLDAIIMLFKNEDQEMISNSIQRKIAGRFNWWINLACHVLIARFCLNLVSMPKPMATESYWCVVIAPWHLGESFGAILLCEPPSIPSSAGFLKK